MFRIGRALVVLGAGAMLLLAGGSCATAPASPSARQASPQGSLRILAAETFLADIAQNVVGERAVVQSLVPRGVDPHSFEPTPADVAVVAECDVLIVNGAGFEAFLERLLQSAGGQPVVIEAAAGLAGREPAPGEHAGEHAGDHEEDPHFWLDPNMVIRYVENIRDGLSRYDPAGAGDYAARAAAYTVQLKELDAWIASQVQALPESQRLLVTNHESLGYFADRYGFTIVGAVVPSVSSGASPSAQQLAGLVNQIRATGAAAIFVETGANLQLAEQVARESGARVVTDLYTHSVTAPDGDAPDYISMMRHNTRLIVEALRQGAERQ